MADLTAARARWNELVARACIEHDSDGMCLMCGQPGGGRPKRKPIPSTPAELVEVLELAGCECHYSPNSDVIAITDRPTNPRVGDWGLPMRFVPTLRAVGAVLTLMEENGR